VGGHRENRQASLLGPETVGMLAAHRGDCAQHAGRVHLVVERELRDVGADGLAGYAPVFVGSLGDVSALAAQVERGVRALAHTADSGREGDLVAVNLPADHSRSFARVSSWSRVLSSGSSTTASRRSWRMCPSLGPGRNPSSVRSLPSTARSPSRCGLGTSWYTPWRRGASASISSNGGGSPPLPRLPSRSACLWSRRSNASSSPLRRRKRLARRGSPFPGRN